MNGARSAVESSLGMWNQWSFVRPWLAPLRGRIYLSQRGDLFAPKFGFAVLEVRYWELPPCKMRRVRDALVLLSMIQRVNPRAWMAILKIHCDLRPQPHLDVITEDRFPNVPFHITVSTLVSQEVGLQQLTNLLSNLDESPSAYFSATARKIASLSTRDCQLPLQIDVPIAIFINACNEGDVAYAERVHNVLRHIVAAHGGKRFPVQMVASNSCSTCCSSMPPPFECTIVLLPIEVGHYIHNLAPNVAHALEEMATSGDEIAVSRMGMNTSMDEQCSSDENPLVIGKLFERVLCANGCPKEKRVNMGNVKLFFGLADVPNIRRICSAISESTTTRGLDIIFELSFDDDNSREAMQLWEILAYALFSKAAGTFITHLQFDVAILTTEIVDAIEQVLCSHDPTTYVFGNRHALGGLPMELTSELKVGVMKQGTPVVVLGEDATTKLATFTVDTNIERVKMVNCGAENVDSANMHVVVPGYGLCSIPKTAFVVAGTPQDKRSHITSLTLSRAMIDADATLIKFLNQVGESLEYLDIGRSVSFPLLFRACPNLKTLIIKCDRFDESDFVKAYNECETNIIHLDVSAGNSQKLAMALADTTTRFAKSLKMLKCKFDKMEDATTISDMLEVNRTLEYLEMFYLPPNEELQRHHNTPLPVPCEPIPISCRLAFLSIFTASRTCFEHFRKSKLVNSLTVTNVGVSKVLADFPVDRQVLSLIFAFAAECVRRCVIVRSI